MEFHVLELRIETNVLNCEDITFVKTIEFMFTGINMFWARILLVLTQAARQKSKRTLRRAQNLFMLKNINSIQLLQQNVPKIHDVILITFSAVKMCDLD